MIDTKLLRQKILDLAIQGKLVPQNPNDEPASVLLEKIRNEKAALVKAGKIKAPKHSSFIFRGEDNRHYENIDGKVTDITDQIPFDVPQGWEWCRLQVLTTIITDGEHTTPRRVTKFCGYYLLSARNIRDTGIQLQNVDYVDEEEYKTISKRCNPHKGDILMSCSGSVGRCCIVKDDNNYVMVRSAALISPMAKVYVNYLLFVLQSSCVQMQIEETKKQTAQANIFQEAIRSFLIPIPPHSEQERIVSCIEQLFALCDTIDKVGTDLETTISLARQKVLDLAIRGLLVPQNPDDEPASVLLKRIQAEKSARVKAGKRKADKHESTIIRGGDNRYYENVNGKTTDITDQIPFEIPPSWEWVRLGNFCRIIMGQSPDGQSIQEGMTGTEFHQGKIYFTDKYLELSPLKTSSPTRVIPAGSVLICVRAPVGIVNISMREICIGRGLAAAIPLCQISIDFLFHWLTVLGGILKAKATGSTFPAVSVEQVCELLIPLPPLVEQKRIVFRIKELFELLDILK